LYLLSVVALHLDKIHFLEKEGLGWIEEGIVG
jgi:hypothetical protein